MPIRVRKEVLPEIFPVKNNDIIYLKTSEKLIATTKTILKALSILLSINQRSKTNDVAILSSLAINE